MRKDHHNYGDGASSQLGPGAHEKFLELCALSTSGELSTEEQRELHAHLAECSDCRQALKEFEAAAVMGVPLLHGQLSAPEVVGPQAADSAISTKASDQRAERKTSQAESAAVEDMSSLARSLSFRNKDALHRTPVKWNYAWITFAAAVVLTAALGIYSYQLGRHKGENVAQAFTPPPVPDPRLDRLEQEISDFDHERQNLNTQLTQRDGAIADLRRQLTEQSTSLVATKKAQEDLKRLYQVDQGEKQELAQQRTTLSEKIDSLQASLQKTETELDSVKQQRSQEQSRAESLEAQIRDLHGQIRDQEQALGKQQDLLAHDRDIRELMGARDLYIAEVYDVADDGQTQKPYGRVFYTKGKSLIFYAYDLDQEPGRKADRTFQAWGSHGLNRQQATSLGVFYEDNLAKKRWVLKFDDPKKLEQIDAVFVTVEPNGGSHKPSGKPLLFAYLKVEPNHP